MKQLLNFSPAFNPTAKTLDFSLVPNFDINKLYAVINVTQGTPIYIPGAAGYGGQTNTSPTIISLVYNTSTHSATDNLNVFYDTAPGVESNFAAEVGGFLEQLAENQNQVLVELKVMNTVLAQGLNINYDDLQAIRDDINNPVNRLTPL